MKEVIVKEIIERDLKKFFLGTGTRKKDYIGDLITIKARNLKDCILYISKTIKFDIIKDPEYGIIKTRFRTSYYGDYKVPIGEYKGFDTLIVICLNRDKQIIEKAFAIPEKELGEKRFITILKTGHTYQKFKIDEKPYNKIYNYMKTEKYSILDDDDIKITHNTIKIK